VFVRRVDENAVDVEHRAPKARVPLKNLRDDVKDRAREPYREPFPSPDEKSCTRKRSADQTTRSWRSVKRPTGNLRPALRRTFLCDLQVLSWS
jgi:hypothetical protein